jgi:hypothetical protein
MPKILSITDKTLKMFPHMANIPMPAIRAAGAIASGVSPEAVGFSECGAGAYTRAYANATHVVKGVALHHDAFIGSASDNTETWLAQVEGPLKHSRMFRRMVRKYIVGTVVLFDQVVVQEKVYAVASAIMDNVSRTSTPGRVLRDLDRLVETLANLLQIEDMHVENWGFTHAGQIKMFDIAPKLYGGGYSADDDRFLSLIDQQITAITDYLRDQQHYFL